jgi:hypothetical protein
LQCSQIGDHPQEDLATFGWTPDMKVEEFTKPFRVKSNSKFWNIPFITNYTMN